MKRTIHAQLIVNPTEGLGNALLVGAVAHHLESMGLKVAVPHVYPEEPLIVEIVEDIPLLPNNYFDR